MGMITVGQAVEHVRAGAARGMEGLAGREGAEGRGDGRQRLRRGGNVRAGRWAAQGRRQQSVVWSRRRDRRLWRIAGVWQQQGLAHAV